MKELSIEEKAKAYDEALKKAKDMLSYKEVRREDMEYLFPELKESEDERVRQFLIHEIEEASDSFMSYYNMSKKDVLAWLEKQQKSEVDPYSLPVSDDSSLPTFDESIYHPCSEKAYWGEDDEKQLQHAMLALQWYAGGTDIINWIKSIKDRVQPQSQWKPSDEQMIALRQVISGCSYDIEPLLELETKLKEF